MESSCVGFKEGYTVQNILQFDCDFHECVVMVYIKLRPLYILYEKSTLSRSISYEPYTYYTKNPHYLEVCNLDKVIKVSAFENVQLSRKCIITDEIK